MSSENKRPAEEALLSTEEKVPKKIIPNYKKIYFSSAGLKSTPIFLSLVKRRALETAIISADVTIRIFKGVGRNFPNGQILRAFERCRLVRKHLEDANNHLGTLCVLADVGTYKPNYYIDGGALVRTDEDESWMKELTAAWEYDLTKATECISEALIDAYIDPTKGNISRLIMLDGSAYLVDHSSAQPAYDTHLHQVYGYILYLFKKLKKLEDEHYSLKPKAHEADKRIRRNFERNLLSLPGVAVTFSRV